MQIRVEAARFTYPGGAAALNGVSLTIGSGEVVALIGENGSGKTTLARHMSGLLRPQAGAVWVGDCDTREHTPAQMARRAGYAFQNPDEQLFRQRVWDEVAFGPQNLGHSPAQVSKFVEQALELLGLNLYAQQNPRDLGFSARKLVALASVLAMQTPVVILDEPTAGLDAGEQERLALALQFLRREGRTIVVVSHDMDFLAENVERLVLLHHGQILHDAPVQEFFQQNVWLASEALAEPQLVRLGRALGQHPAPMNVQQFLEGLRG